MLPQTTDGMKHVCYFRHALALDERRVKFLPEYACGETGKRKLKGKMPSSDNRICSDNDAPPDKTKHSANTAGRTVNEKSTTFHETSVDRLQVKKDSAKPKHTMEVWFAGTHSDM